MAASESYRTDTLVGIFVLLGLIVISVLVFTIAGKQKLFEPRYRLTALFTQVAGLKVGSPVRLAGLEVGTVESLDFTADGKVLAILSLQTRYRNQIRGDSVATISSVGILGDKSVEITIGSKIVGVLGFNSRIQTKDPFDVAAFVDHVAPMTAKVDEILSYLSKITSEFSMGDVQLAETMEHANAILKKLNEGKGTFGTAMNNPALYNELVSFARSGKEATGQLKATLGRIESASVELPALLESTRKAMGDISAIAENLHSSTERIPEITKNISDASINIQTAARDLPAIAGSFRRASREAEDVMDAAKQNWLIRKNLPERSTTEENLPLEGSPFSHGETGP